MWSKARIITRVQPQNSPIICLPLCIRERRDLCLASSCSEVLYVTIPYYKAMSACNSVWERICKILFLSFGPQEVHTSQAEPARTPMNYWLHEALRRKLKELVLLQEIVEVNVHAGYDWNCAWKSSLHLGVANCKWCHRLKKWLSRER